MNTTAAELMKGQRVIVNGDSALVEDVRPSLVGYTITLNDGRELIVSATATVTVI